MYEFVGKNPALMSDHKFSYIELMLDITGIENCYFLVSIPCLWASFLNVHFIFRLFLCIYHVDIHPMLLLKVLADFHFSLFFLISYYIYFFNFVPFYVCDFRIYTCKKQYLHVDAPSIYQNGSFYDNILSSFVEIVLNSGRHPNSLPGRW